MTKQELQDLNLPDEPGVYFFRDEENNILYIGKATSLRDRTRSYFALDLKETRGLRVVSMVMAAKVVTWQETASVLEALLLEAELIKQYKPMYNVREKDDSSFVCVVVTDEEYPRVLVMRVRDFEKTFNSKQCKKVYGPFTSMRQMQEALQIIRKMFPFRDKCEVNQGKPCFNAQIGLCPGMCFGNCDKGSYAKTLVYVMNMFEGKRGEVVKSLKIRMNELAAEEKFEEAAKIRNTLFALDHIKDSALIIDERLQAFKDRDFRIEAFDAAHMGGDNRVGVMVVIAGGEKKSAEYRKFKLPEGINDDYAALREILARRIDHKEWRYPDLIVIDGGQAHKSLAETLLADRGLFIPVVSVVKDEKHKPKDVLGRSEYVDNHKRDILLANSESHRFAITYHKLLRNKIK